MIRIVIPKWHTPNPISGTERSSIHEVPMFVTDLKIKVS
jgi:hypothetical protein